MIKADKWIIRKSAKPTHVAMVDGQPIFMHWNVDREEIENLQEFDRGMKAEMGRGMYQIREVVDDDLEHWRPMIEPFVNNQVRVRKGPLAQGYDGPVPTHIDAISYGVSSYGYDVRVADEFKVFTNVHGGRVDPKNFDPKNYVDITGPELIIPPNGFALARTVEYMRIPRNVLTICLGKSTYARCGIIVNVTPLEPEWEGHVTLEFSNTTNLPAVVYANEGVAQFLFLESDEDCKTSYKDRQGKYQGQTGVVTPRM